MLYYICPPEGDNAALEQRLLAVDELVLWRRDSLGTPLIIGPELGKQIASPPQHLQVSTTYFSSSAGYGEV